MRPAARSQSLSFLNAPPIPFEHVDYRLAETPETRQDLSPAHRAYLREGAILPSESERVTDRTTTCPILYFGHLCSWRALQLLFASVS